jgi:hypothetical protein
MQIDFRWPKVSLDDDLLNEGGRRVCGVGGGGGEKQCDGGLTGLMNKQRGPFERNDIQDVDKRNPGRDVV